MKQISIFDTTLRDGMQGIEINFTLEDKLSIAQALDSMAIDYIEGGFPLANEKEMAFFKACRNIPFKHSKIVAFGSTRRPEVAVESDTHIHALLDADTSAITIVGKSWTEHVTKVIGTNLAENLRMISESIAFLKKEGREVIFDLEHFFDGYVADRSYALSVLQAGIDSGADALVLCDTNGGFMPLQIQEVYRDLVAQHPVVCFGAHFHNDCGMAVANSVLAVQSGATHVQGTINGWGERCGNANLCSIIPNLVFKLQESANCAINLEHLTSLSRFVSEKANIIPDKRQPYVGSASFAHKAGQHADVINKAPYLMEHMDAGLVGNERQLLLSELAGKSTIMDKMKKYGNFSKQDSVVNTLTLELKQREGQGYEYEAAEGSFDLVMRKALGLYKPMVQLKNYHLESFKTSELQSNTVGRMFLNNNGHEIMGASVGVGPVGTLDGALRNALLPHFPFLSKIRLVDYRVRVLNPENATGAKVRVFMTSSDGDSTWGTVGVNENIVEASFEALVDSFEFYFNSRVLTSEKQ